MNNIYLYTFTNDMSTHTPPHLPLHHETFMYLCACAASCLQLDAAIALARLGVG